NSGISNTKKSSSSGFMVKFRFEWGTIAQIRCGSVELRCEPCCTVAGVVAVAFSTAIALRGWPSGDWSFGWGAVGAISTVLLSGIAAYISYVQKKWMEERREADALRIS